VLHRPRITGPYHAGPSILHDRLLYWTSILTLITTMLSCGLVIASHLRPTPIPVDAPRVLRRPSPYVNPDKLREAARLHNATFPPIVNNGPSAFQMRAGDVKRAITEDASRQWTSSIGTVWPEDRHFVVSSNVGTVPASCGRALILGADIHSLPVPQPRFRHGALRTGREPPRADGHL
jgi:hypothetical protein